MLQNFQSTVSIKKRFTGTPCFVNFQSNLMVINKGKFLLSFSTKNVVTEHDFHQHVDAESRQTIPYQ